MYQIKWRGKVIRELARESASDGLGVLGKRVAKNARARIAKHKLARPGGHWRTPGALSEHRRLQGGSLRDRPGKPPGGYLWAEFPAFQVEHGVYHKRLLRRSGRIGRATDAVLGRRVGGEKGKGLKYLRLAMRQEGRNALKEVRAAAERKARWAAETGMELL